MNLLTLIGCGTGSIVRLAQAGLLTRERLWTAMNGASAYFDALKRGDIAPTPTADERSGVCATCPAVTREGLVVMGLGVTKLYCGEAFKDRLGDPQPTCGCLVGLTIDGKPYGGGKTSVMSERCPQGKW